MHILGWKNYIHFTGIRIENNAGGSGFHSGNITKLDMDILAAYNASIANTSMYMDRDKTKGDGILDGWLDKEGYYDVNGKKLKVYWFGKNRGQINYEKDLKSKIDSWFKGNPEVTTEEEELEAEDAAFGSTQPSSDWNLTLVNASFAVPANFATPDTINTKYVQGNEESKYIDKRVKSSLESMLKACSDAGYSPLVVSAYRTNEQQRALYGNGSDTLVAKPGHSEHECGLAADIIDNGPDKLTGDPLVDAQAGTPAQKWLMAHCHKYGFILRYPKNKESITGIGYEPWHYRYVGTEAAKKIKESGQCLEEYLGAESAGASSGNSSSKPSKSKHLFKIVVGSSPVKSGDSYILPVTVKECEVEDVLEGIFGLVPDGEYVNSKATKGAENYNSKKADENAVDSYNLLGTEKGSATNLEATYSISDTTGNVLFGALSYVQADGGFAKGSGVYGTGSLKLPLEPGSFTVTDHFAVADTEGIRQGRTHSGVDLGAPTGTPVYASLAGTVTLADYNGSYGNCIKIESGSTEIIYAHLSKINVSSGDSISLGQLIGLVGSTGNSTGPHLHFEVRQGGKAIDPEPLLGLK